ncbi:DUF6248 family natural product biosynthesis protein [Streptomyces californicus]|uniref:DUF6248 family natural product biosynthesis protein n=1 Tax=Streptomyces californicus TaxID=67351 RepID=UPI003656B7DF
MHSASAAPPQPGATETAYGDPTPETCLRVAREAAALAAAADDHALSAACRSTSRAQAHRDEVMHAVHREAVEAEGHAARAEQYAADPSMPDTALRYCASGAVDYAVRAQEAAGVEATAAALRAELERRLTPAEHAERETERRRAEAEQEAEERAATGMDADNRHLARMNAYFAESAVPRLGWTAGHVRVLEAAETGCLYQREGRVRQAAERGTWSGGRKVSRERTQGLHAAGFLVVVDAADGARVLAATPMGQVALELARLHPEGLYESDKAAYEARYARVAKRYKRMDDKKDAARRLPALERSVGRYRRPVTLVEQETRAAREATEQWEDEGGYCPGVETPAPAVEEGAGRSLCCGLHEVTKAGVIAPHKPTRAATGDCPGSGLRPGAETPGLAAEARFEKRSGGYPLMSQGRYVKGEERRTTDPVPTEPAPAAAVPAAARVPTPPAAGIDQPLLRRLFVPRSVREQRPADGTRTVIRRPQRILTPEERERVRDMPLLNRQGALIMGITDPVPNASPMPEEAGAWVREHAWPAHWQAMEDRYPFGFHRWSTCERGTCWNCLNGRCDICVHRQNGGPSVDSNREWVTNHQGRTVAEFIPRPDGEPCVWWCRCECPKDGPAPALPAQKRAAASAPAASDPAPARAAVTVRKPETGATQAALW